MAEEERVCKVCDEPKPLEGFRAYTKGRYLYRLRTCIPCQREKDKLRQREYMEKNREAHNRRARLDKSIRYDTDPAYREKMKARSREYYRRNREKILAKKRAKRAKS